MTDLSRPPRFPESLVDQRPPPVSLRNIVGRFFLRPKLFLFAFLLPPLIAMFLAALVPVDWSATTKILIRYGVSDTSLLRDISPDIRLGLSGTTSAELIKSTPVVEKTIESVDVHESDIYRKPTDVLTGLLSAMVRGSNKESTGDPAQDRRNRVAALAGQFKDSLDSSSKKASSNKSVEILDKPSQMPDVMKLDELISLEVRSFNREKVAAMTNGLARAFIDEYYRIYGDEAGRQYRYLDGLVNDAEKQLVAVQAATPSELTADIGRASSGKELVSRDVPILNNMAAQLMEVEGRLARATQIYARGSPEVKRLQGQSDEMKFMLARQERIEIGKQVLEQLKLRRYQAFNTETVYKDRLIPISIAEFAQTPKASSTKKALRVLVAGAVGSVLGLIFAATLMIVLSTLDPRIHARRDIEALVTTPVIGRFAARGLRTGPTDLRAIATDAGVGRAALQILTAIHQHAATSGARVIVVTAVTQGDGATFTALALAASFARDRARRVCLVDADLAGAGLTRGLGLSDRHGFVDAIGDAPTSAEPWLRIDDLHLTVVPMGQPAPLGYYAEAAKVLLDRLRGTFDTIIIDAGPALTSNEAVILGQLADQTLLVAASGSTRKGGLRAASDKLASMNVRVAGVVLNRTRNLLPGFLYRNLD